MVTTSKRSALRFDGCNLPVLVKSASQLGKGVLRNVSTQGCAIVELEVSLREGERVLVEIGLEAGVDPFQAQGQVVRQQSQPDCTAVQFTLVENECQTRLRNFFSRLVRERGNGSASEISGA